MEGMEPCGELVLEFKSLELKSLLMLPRNEWRNGDGDAGDLISRPR